MSKDLEIIKAEAARREQLDKAMRASGLDLSPSELLRDFEVVARALNGEKAKNFAALRCLVRRFGRCDTYYLIKAASEISYHEWRLSIRKRIDKEQPDQRRRRKKWEKEFRWNEIGLAYYDYRLAGFSHQEAIQKTRQRLRLNLSARTFKQELLMFRQAAKRRGYVDPYATLQGGFSLGSYREPKILVSDLMRKGRPKKSVQNPVD